ncbi:putative T7SS-secreted protein [Amycolatopsis anabasis]|uniref:putative T7SS-secreted protein n=1 Tax=Amycolatopsis anabasis TaxID=1840409 RepID=UPI0024835E61|nr:NucA/NucB deoxyribonuclease domain-containing protein [Amycolatopsis anabasis]
MAELGETADPKQLIPGEAHEIRLSKAHLVTYGDTMIEIGGGFQKLDTGGWTGPAADAYHEIAHPEAGRWITAGEAFHSAAAAIETYAGTLEWAQGEAARAVALWQQGEQASAQAKAQHDQAIAAAAQQAAAEGSAPPPEAPFTDPGEALRGQAREVLARARDQLTAAGDQAVAIVDKAQEHAPQERTLLDDMGDALETIGDIPGNVVHNALDELGDMVDAVGTGVGKLVEGAGWLAGQAVDGTGNVVGAGLDALGLDETGRDVEQATETAASATTSATRDAGHAVEGYFDREAATLHDRADTIAEQLGAEPHEWDQYVPDPGQKHYVVINEDKYPESADHILEAQNGEIWRGDTSAPGQAKPAEVTIDRPGADINRRESLNGIPTRGGDYLDRDEYPPAVFREGGEGASVKYIDRGDNRGSGSSMMHQMKGLENGTPVHISVG